VAHPPYDDKARDQRFFPDAATVGAATTIVTVAGATQAGKDIVLRPDVTPPVVDVSGEGTFKSVADVDVYAYDTGSDVKTVSYQLDTGSIITTQPFAAGVTVYASGSHTLKYSAVDNAGNRSATMTTNFSVVPGPAVPGSWTKATGDASEAKWVDFVSESAGFAGGDDAVFKTADGGGTWTPKTMAPILGGYPMIEFASETHGWIAGRFGQVYATEDGGATWSLRPIGTLLDVTGVSFVDELNGWVSADAGYGGRIAVFHTSDGGLTWTCQKSDTLGYLQNISFRPGNALDGIAVGAYIPGVTGRVLQTHNGGDTWTSATLPLWAPGQPYMTKLWAACQIDASNAWVGGYEDSLLFKTTNAGGTWSLVDAVGQEEGYGPDVRSIVFADLTHGWIATGRDTFHTGNGGAAWSYVPNRTLAWNGNLTGFSFPSADHGWAVIGEGGLYKYDGGVAAVKYNVTATHGTGGSITPEGVTQVDSGLNSPTYMIAASAGYVIGDVKVDNVSVGAVDSYTITNVTGARTISATFKKIPKLSISASPTTSSNGKAIALSGTIAPNVANNSHIMVWIRSSTATTWSLVSTRHTSKSHHWSYSLSTTTRAHGTYYAKVTYAGSSTLAPATSSQKTLVVK
jgi:photosystem II stability/assembly factor-like uncharacterized protein